MPPLSPITATTDDSLEDSIVSILCMCNFVYIFMYLPTCQSVCTYWVHNFCVCVQVPSWVEREFRLAQNVFSNLPTAVDSTLSPCNRPLRNEKISLMSITQDDVPPAAIQRVSSSDHIKEGDQIVKGPPVHKHLERVSSGGDFGADAAPSNLLTQVFLNLTETFFCQMTRDRTLQDLLRIQ